MAKHRRRTRTHVAPTEEEVAEVPKSMVIGLGKALTNNSIGQLVKDMRNVMQPHTAISLQERKANKLKDFVVMAGPLLVSHILIFTQSESGNVSLKLGRFPRGPTVTFKVGNYSLCKDIRKVLKNPKSTGKDSKQYLNPPLLVLNGFVNPTDAEPQEKLLITMLQSMFPPISPQDMKVSSIRRVLILNKNEKGEIDLRHYQIDTKAVEISKSIKRLVTVEHKTHKRLPNLAKVNDVADFVLDPYANGGFTSDSEIEEDEIVQIGQEEPAQVKSQAKKRAVKLTEIGPRIKLELVKIEEGICGGKVMYHSQVNKSQLEIRKLEQKHAVRRKLKLQRRKEQQENVDAKNEKKDAKKLKRKLKKAEGEQDDQESEKSGEESGEDLGDDSDGDKLFSEDE